MVVDLSQKDEWEFRKSSSRDLAFAMNSAKSRILDPC